MGFGDSAGGLLEGFRMANQDLQAKHQQLMNDAISQAQQQHAQQELDQQKTQEDNLNKYRTAQSYGQMLKSFQDYQDSGGTGSRFYGMWSPAAGDDKNMGAFLESIKNQGQSPEYLAAQKALQAQGDAAKVKAQNEQDNAMRVLQEKYIEHQTTLNPHLDPNVAMRAAQATYPTSGGGQNSTNGTSGTNSAPSSSVFPNNHQQNASDAVAKASPGGPALGTMTMPPQSSPVVSPQQVLPPVNGGAAPPASPSTGAGVPQSMVNPTSQITGDQGQAPPGQMQGGQGANGVTPGLPAPAPPQPIQAINPNPYDGISAAFNLKQAAQAQKDHQEEVATQIQEETLRQLRERFPGEQVKAKLDAIYKAQQIKIEAQQVDQANKLFPGNLAKQNADINASNASSWATVQNAKTNAGRLAFEKTKDALDRADNINGKMSATEITGAYTNARQLLDMKKDFSSQLLANQAAESSARWYLDPNNVAIPAPSDPKYADVMQKKADANASISGIFDPETQKPGPSPLEAQRNILKYNIDQTQDLIDKTQIILNRVGGAKPTNNGGKPDKVYDPTKGNSIPGAPPGTQGNGKNSLKFPTNQSIPAAGQKLIKAGGGKVDYKSMSTADLLKRLGQKVK